MVVNCGICYKPMEPGRIGRCDDHPVNDAWDTFWKIYFVDLDKIHESGKLMDALLESFRVAARLPKVKV